MEVVSHSGNHTAIFKWIKSTAIHIKFTQSYMSATTQQKINKQKECEAKSLKSKKKNWKGFAWQVSWGKAALHTLGAQPVLGNLWRESRLSLPSSSPSMPRLEAGHAYTVHRSTFLARTTPFWGFLIQTPLAKANAIPRYLLVRKGIITKTLNQYLNK